MNTIDMSAYKEQVSHGSMLMPMCSYRCTFLDDPVYVPLHWHEEMEITCIREGRAEYDINFETYPVERGDILLLSPHVLHAVRPLPESKPGKMRGMSSDSLVFHLDLPGASAQDACAIKYLNPLQRGTAAFRPILGRGERGCREISDCFGRLQSCFLDQKAGYELQTKSLLLELIYLTYQYGCVNVRKEAAPDSQTQERLKTILAYIGGHYSERMSVEELSAVCHFSPVYFMNFFKRYVGMTSVEYINNYRLSMAAAALAQTDQPVMEIALDHGFSNISYFNKLFRNKFGRTPKEYRRLIRLETGKQE